MTTFGQHLDELRKVLADSGASVSSTKLPSGAHLVEIKQFRLVPGWNRDTASLLFVAPPAYPTAAPDSFWVEPVGMRLVNGSTPQNTNDANPIPEVGPRGTWFSWHVQDWRPNQSSLITFFSVIKNRLDPPR
jgi:Prokaryotic E2 family E